jgi:integrase/recombinase XerC
MKTMQITIKSSMQAYLDMVQSARRLNTYKAYRNAINLFQKSLEQNAINSSDAPVNLPEDAVAWFLTMLKNYSIATERLYLTAIYGYYEFLFAERWASPNLPRIKSLITRRARKPIQRLPQFPKYVIELILDHVINYAAKATSSDPSDVNENLRNYRDRAFLLVLADTGLRVHEACNLDRGSIDWAEAKAVVEIKGGRQSVVRFSERSINALRAYLTARAILDGASGRPITSLPLFARHDRGAGKKIKRITTTTGRNIVNQRVYEVLGSGAVGTITPHSFRHYFVTVVLQASGNLKLAQELARHRNIAITQRYAHLSDDELDAGYHGIFNQEAPRK